MKPSILATGISGLVGTRVQELLQDQFEFTDLSLATGVDVTNYEDLESHISNSPAKIILHMAAKTDVDGCEDDKIFGEEGKAWIINVTGTENIVKIAEKCGKKVIYISTDFVFDGTRDSYSEEDEANPLNWYAVTKYEAEKLVLAQSNSCVIRIAYPYRSTFPAKKDFVRRILDKMERKETIIAVTDHIITPTFIDDIAKGLGIFLNNDLNGIYHLVGGQSMSVYDAVGMIALEFNFTDIDVRSVSREVFFKERAYRPFKLVLKNDKIKKLGFEMLGFDHGLKIIRHQMLSARI